MKSPLTLLLLVLLLLGCESREEAAHRLVLWEQKEPAEQVLLARHMAEFEASHPGVTVDAIHFAPENLRHQYQTAGLARTGPDLVFCPADFVGPFSIMGLVQPLETLVPPDSLALFMEDAKPSLAGHVYMLADQVGNHLTLVYNKAYVDAPAEDTETWLAQLREQTVDVDGDGRIDRYGLVFNLTEPFWLVPWLGGYGGWVMDEQGEPTLDTPAMAEALAFVRRLVEMGVVPPSCDYPLADTLFKEGSAAYIINGPWSWQSYRDVGVDIGLTLLPKVSETGLYPTPMTSCKGYCMNAFVPEEKRELVLELLDFLTSARVVGQVARELGAPPSRLDVAAWPELAQDETLMASWRQLRAGQLMPVVPEMRVLWDVMRPGLQGVVAGSADPEDAARQMQKDAVRLIQEMRL